MLTFIECLACAEQCCSYIYELVRSHPMGKIPLLSSFVEAAEARRGQINC